MPARQDLNPHKKLEVVKMKVWYDGRHIDMEIGQTVTVFRCGSGLSTFGEAATLSRVTAQHLVFTTESGATVKTSKYNIHRVIGRARDNNWCVSLRAYEAFTHIIHENVRFWDKKTCTLVKK